MGEAFISLMFSLPTYLQALSTKFPDSIRPNRSHLCAK